MPTEPTRATIRTLARLARVLERSSDDLTLAQYRLLATVAEGSERATLLAGRLSVAKPSVSTMVDALVARGLLARADVDGDRRGVRLRLTPAGRRALIAAELTMHDRLAPLLDACDDRQTVERALAQLGAALDWAAAARLARA